MHVWSNRDFGAVDSDDLLALAAAVCMYIKLHLSLQQQYPHSLPELLTAFTAGRKPDGVPVLHNAFTIQRVVHSEFRMLQQLGYQLTTLTPMAWVDIFRQRLTLRQWQPQGDPSTSSDRQLVLTPSVSLPNFVSKRRRLFHSGAIQIISLAGPRDSRRNDFSTRTARTIVNSPEGREGTRRKPPAAFSKGE